MQTRRSAAHLRGAKSTQSRLIGCPAARKRPQKALPNWEGLSASGVVFDGKSKDAGKFLIASAAWTSFNQGPILNLDLSAVPHDQVRVSFDLYTFGDWRGLQRKTGGPQHRLMFFDGKAEPKFAFDTNFATNDAFKQHPGRTAIRSKTAPAWEPSRRKVDTTGRFKNAHRWPVTFEYESNSPSLRFTMLCGAAAGSGARMPHFGIDNVRVAVRATLARRALAEAGHAKIEFTLEKDARLSLAVYDAKSGVQHRELARAERERVWPAGKHVVTWDGLDRDGKPVAAGEYRWRLLETQGFTARFVGPLGINPAVGAQRQVQ